MRVMDSHVPARAPTWLLGGRLGVQVWQVTEDDRVWASVLVGSGGPIVLLNQAVVDTEREGQSLNWALARVAEARPGFYVYGVGDTR